MSNNTEQYTILSDMLAEYGHNGQFRNDGRTPYITHPRAARKIGETIRATLFPHLDKEYLAQTINMHDLVEDTEMTLEDIIQHGFDEPVILAIRNITKNPTKGAESYKMYLDRVASSMYNLVAKLADLSHNMSDLKPGNMRDKYELATWYLKIHAGLDANKPI